MANSISKTVAVLVILLLASSFVLGNIFAGYKAEKMAQDYKTQASDSVANLKDEYKDLLWEEKVKLMQGILNGNTDSQTIEGLLEQEGIYLIRLNLAAQGANEGLDYQYQLWLHNLEQNLNNQRKSIIIHSGHY